MPGAYPSPIIGLGSMPFSGLLGPQIVFTVIDKNDEPTPPLGEGTGPQGALYAAMSGFGGGEYGGFGFDGFQPPFGWPTQQVIQGFGNSTYGPGPYGGGGQWAGGAGAGFAGFGSPWQGTYNNYRLLLQHPTVQLARSIVFGSILIGHWNYVVEKDTPQEIVDWYMKYFPPLRQKFLQSALRALDYGWFPFEKVWKIDGDLICLDQLKPLQVDFNCILIDIRGNFAGLRQNIITGGLYQIPENKTPKPYFPYDLPPNKSHIYTYDGESGRLYGRSRLDNVRRTVGDWYTTNDHVERLSRKATGLILWIKVPPGGPQQRKINPKTGQPCTWTEYADAFAAQIVSGTGCGYIISENSIGFELKADGTARAKAEAIEKMAAASFWGIESVDLGDNGPMLEALTAECDYKDKLIFRGYLCPERSGMQGQHGTQEDAGQHTDTGSGFINATHDDIVANFNLISQQALIWNFGERYKNAIHAEAVHINDLQERVDSLIIQGGMGNKDIAPHIYSQYDIGEVFQRRGIPKRATPLTVTTSDGDGSGSRPSSNGNGNGNGHPSPASRNRVFTE